MLKYPALISTHVSVITVNITADCDVDFDVNCDVNCDYQSLHDSLHHSQHHNQFKFNEITVNNYWYFLSFQCNQFGFSLFCFFFVLFFWFILI